MDRARLVPKAEADKRRKLMQEALEIASGAGDPFLTASIRIRLGEMSAGFDEAEHYYRAGLAAAEQQRDPYLAAWALLDLGYNRGNVARYDEALPFLNRARQAAQQCGAKSFFVMASGNEGWCYWRLGDLDRAMQDVTFAEDLSRKIGLRDAQHRWLGVIGNIYMERGDLDRAAVYQKRAVDVARSAGNEAWLAIAKGNLGLIALEKNDLSAARSYNDEAIAIYSRLKNRRSMVYGELTGAGIETNAGNYTQAEKLYRQAIQEAPQVRAPDVLWQAQGGLAALYGKTHRPELAGAEYRAAIGTIDDEWKKLSSDASKTTFLNPSYLIGLFQDYVAFLIENGQPERALEMAESSRARLLAQKLERAKALPADLRIGRLIALARSTGTTILSYWLAPDHSSVWAIGRKGLSRYSLPSDKEIGDLVRRYTATVTQGGDPMASAADSAALYNAVLGPVAGAIPAGSSVIIVPDGALHELNFETLIVPKPRPHYWIEDVTIATAPALRVLEGGRPSPPRAPKLLLLGDPVLTGQEFGPLVHVKDEIANVERYFPAGARVALTGAKAVPGAYRASNPGNYTYIHFATHATANRDSPLNSAIILSHQGDDFKLYARDVADVPLNADLVTISACHSAGAKAYAGEGLMGFAWAFLQSRAQNVIASLWDVDDAHSPEMMRRLYEGLARGESPARALRAAKLDLLRSESSSRLPYYWGSLQVFTRTIAVGTRDWGPGTGEQHRIRTLVPSP